MAALVSHGLIGLLALLVSASLAVASDPAPGEAWKTNPHHGTINGATGQKIPCVCRFQGRDYRLGDSVCMNTHVGTVIARCDLLLNNTTWAPTSEPCTISSIPAQSRILAFWPGGGPRFKRGEAGELCPQPKLYSHCTSWQQGVIQSAAGS